MLDMQSPRSLERHRRSGFWTYGSRLRWLGTFGSVLFLLSPSVLLGQDPIISPGDRIQIDVLSREALSTVEVVESSGQLRLSTLQGIRIAAAGRPVSEVRQHIAELFDSVMGIGPVRVNLLANETQPPDPPRQEPSPPVVRSDPPTRPSASRRGEPPRLEALLDMNVSGMAMGFESDGLIPNDYWGLSVGVGLGALFSERLAITGFADFGWAVQNEGDNSMNASQYGVSARLLLREDEESGARPFIGGSVGQTRLAGVLLTRFRDGRRTEDEFSIGGTMMGFEIGVMHRALLNRWTSVSLEIASSDLDRWKVGNRSFTGDPLGLATWRVKVSVDW